MRRGEIRFVDLEPARGAEANKRRPCLIVTRDDTARRAESLGWGVITVVPLTSNTNIVYSFQLLLPAQTAGLPVDSKVQCEQIRSVAVERIGERLGKLPPDVMRAVEEKIRLHLGL